VAASMSSGDGHSGYTAPVYRLLHWLCLVAATALVYSMMAFVYELYGRCCGAWLCGRLFGV
jgi:hypothetical protein